MHRLRKKTCADKVRDHSFWRCPDLPAEDGVMRPRPRRAHLSYRLDRLRRQRRQVPSEGREWRERFKCGVDRLEVGGGVGVAHAHAHVCKVEGACGGSAEDTAMMTAWLWVP